MTVDDAARPSVTQIVNNAAAQCRQQTNGSEYDMALWLHDWTLDQLEYDQGLNWYGGLDQHHTSAADQLFKLASVCRLLQQFDKTDLI